MWKELLGIKSNIPTKMLSIRIGGKPYLDIFWVCPKTGRTSRVQVNPSYYLLKNTVKMQDNDPCVVLRTKNIFTFWVFLKQVVAKPLVDPHPVIVV